MSNIWCQTSVTTELRVFYRDFVLSYSKLLRHRTCSDVLDHATLYYCIYISFTFLCKLMWCCTSKDFNFYHEVIKWSGRNWIDRLDKVGRHGNLEKNEQDGAWHIYILNLKQIHNYKKIGPRFRWSGGK